MKVAACQGDPMTSNGDIPSRQPMVTPIAEPPNIAAVTCKRIRQTHRHHQHQNIKTDSDCKTTFGALHASLGGCQRRHGPDPSHFACLCLQSARFASLLIPNIELRTTRLNKPEFSVYSTGPLLICSCELCKTCHESECMLRAAVSRSQCFQEFLYSSLQPAIPQWFQQGLLQQHQTPYFQELLQPACNAHCCLRSDQHVLKSQIRGPAAIT